MATVPVHFGTLREHYPRRPGLTPELKKFMDSIPGTPCCVQMSHALNMSQQYVPKTFKGARRQNSKITIDGDDYYYLLAVDEMEAWLTNRYGEGEVVHLDEDGKRRKPSAIKSYLYGYPGILVFRDIGFGMHTELWDGAAIVQEDIAVDKCLSSHRVLFWNTQLAEPLYHYGPNP